jgi:acyl-CoA reductase-like NAD-dependent aldehyde dehydrogenase
MSDSKTTEKKPVAKKTTAKAPATKAVAKPSTATVTKAATTTKAKAVKPASEKAPAKAKGVKKIGPEQRYKMVEMAAYYIAERHGFEGHPSDYWIQAEAQIEAMLGK